MKKKLIRSMLVLALISTLLALGFVLPRLHQVFVQRTAAELEDTANLLAKATDGQPERAILLARMQESLPNVRISWIDGTGRVLYDSGVAHPDTLENHADRDEIIRALQSGEGTASRQSASLGEDTYYYARRLGDGTVLRVAKAERSTLAEVFGLVPSLLLIALLVIGLSSALAELLTQRLVEPINELDLEHPEENDTYDELGPLLKRLSQQNARIEEQIAANRENTRQTAAIMENMSEGLLLLSPEGKLLSINQSALALLGTTVDAALGHHYVAACRNIDLHAGIEEALRGRRSERRMALAGHIYQVHANPVQRENELDGVIVLFLDVTDHAQAEATRREFSANVSHELKSPLTTIAGYAEMMQSGLADAQDNRMLSGKILDEARRLLALIEDIIRLSRLDEAEGPLSAQPVDLYALAQSVLARCTTFAQARSISLALHGEPAVIEGNPAVLDEVLHNLVDNAIRYNVDGGSVTVSVTDGDKQVRLHISDTGVGIAPEHHSRIFERFYRVDKSHSRETGGTGLGLSIVKHSVQMHGGSIRLESGAGKGAAFILTFPKQTGSQG